MIERRPPAADPEAQLRREGLAPSPWSAPPGTVFGRHHHEAAKRLHVVSGSISFEGLNLEAGEGIRIPRGYEHGAVVGDAGVECVEAFEA